MIQMSKLLTWYQIIMEDHVSYVYYARGDPEGALKKYERRKGQRLERGRVIVEELSKSMCELLEGHIEESPTTTLRRARISWYTPHNGLI